MSDNSSRRFKNTTHSHANIEKEIYFYLRYRIDLHLLLKITFFLSLFLVGYQQHKHEVGERRLLCCFGNSTSLFFSSFLSLLLFLFSSQYRRLRQARLCQGSCIGKKNASMIFSSTRILRTTKTRQRAKEELLYVDMYFPVLKIKRRFFFFLFFLFFSFTKRNIYR